MNRGRAVVAPSYPVRPTFTAVLTAYGTVRYLPVVSVFWAGAGHWQALLGGAAGRKTTNPRLFVLVLVLLLTMYETVRKSTAVR